MSLYCSQISRLSKLERLSFTVDVCRGKRVNGNELKEEVKVRVNTIIQLDRRMRDTGKRGVRYVTTVLYSLSVFKNNVSKDHLPSFVGGDGDNRDFLSERMRQE